MCQSRPVGGGNAARQGRVGVGLTEVGQARSVEAIVPRTAAAALRLKVW